MKTKLLLFILLASSFANAASTIAFSSTTDFATNWGGPVGGSGDGNTARYVWGIIVDTGRNGFLDGSYVPGFSLNSASTTNNNAGTPVALSVAAGVTDDFLIMSGFSMNLTTNTTDSAVVGQNRITGLNSFSYALGMDGGDPYKIIWFNLTSANNNNPGGTATAGLAYGTFAPASLSTIPADGTASISYAPAFDGVDSLKTMAFTVVPETSTSLLGAIGALALLRRRRN
jgi:hypothetical protein